ncbi:MAG: hypothetical protein AVDCRST_MAG02-3651, partial [uncultured Rubrobacteraceae bacterium]
WSSSSSLACAVVIRQTPDRGRQTRAAKGRRVLAAPTAGS